MTVLDGLTFCNNFLHRIFADSFVLFVFIDSFYFSNLMQDILLGNDELIDFSDFLGGDDNEQMRQPHAVQEKELDIL